MTLTLPEHKTDLLNGRHEAANIAEACTVAYWLASRDQDAAMMHFDAIHSNFAALAEALGYDVTRKAAPVDAVPA